MLIAQPWAASIVTGTDSNNMYIMHFFEKEAGPWRPTRGYHEDALPTSVVWQPWGSLLIWEIVGHCPRKCETVSSSSPLGAWFANGVRCLLHACLVFKRDDVYAIYIYIYLWHADKCVHYKIRGLSFTSWPGPLKRMLSHNLDYGLLYFIQN